MTDNLTKKQRRKNMQNIRSKNTSIENTLSAELKKLKLKFERNDVSIPGKPDFVFKRKRVLVFADSCFWHVCPYHFNIPKSNKKYWVSKLRRNKERDKEVNKFLREEGWKVIRIWEHQIKTNPEKAVNKITSVLNLK